MINSKKNKLEWLLFLGKVINRTDDQVDLYATDGSEGVIRVNRKDFNTVDNRIYIVLGCKVQTLKAPKTHPFISSNSAFALAKIQLM
jgi:hypothetical protein